MNKICILGSDGISGGVTNYIINLINFSNKLNKYYIFGKNFKIYKKGIKKKFSFINFNINYSFLSIFTSLILLKNLIEKNKIKIVHAHTQRAAFLICLIKLFLIKKIKIVYTPHGFRHSQLKSPKKFFHLLIEKFILKKIDHVILITKKENFFLDSLKLLNIKKTIIKTSIPKVKFKKSISLRNQFNIESKKKIIVMCGSVQKIKQPKLFLEIAEKINNTIDDVYFFWIGKKIDLPNKFRNEKIKFIGNIDNKLRYYSFMKSADIFLMTSKLETYPIAVLEARNVGLPIVCNSFDGVEDILEKSKFEIKFKYNSSDSAVKILKKLLSIKKSEFKKNKIINTNKLIYELCKKHLYIYNTLK